MKTPRLRLGSEMDDSIPFPSITPGKWASTESTGSWRNKVIYSINTSTLDEDSGLGMDIDQLPPSSDPTSAIIDAVDRMTFESDLIADGSKTYSLTTTLGKHKDLRYITTDTMAAVLSGAYAGIDRCCTMIDCRYPYEFEGGHIEGAVNLYTKEMMQRFLHQTFNESYNTQRRILIFHCEFSSERGPNMYRFLREQDRILNKDKYPHLCYPEVYLLEGGYKAFYESHMHYCDPMDYKPMLHKDHAAQLRLCKTKSKSWAAGDKRQSRLCHKLDF